MTISVRLSETDWVLFKKYAAVHNLTMSELLRRCTLEKISESFEKDIYGIEVERRKIVRAKQDKTE